MPFNGISKNKVNSVYMIIKYDCSTDVKLMLNALLTGVQKEEKKELKKILSYVI
jgi:hypothetical protein